MKLRLRVALSLVCATTTAMLLATGCSDTSGGSLNGDDWIRGGGANTNEGDTSQNQGSGDNSKIESRVCSKNEDCPTGKVCSLTGQCLDADDPCVSVRCAEGTERCEAGLCVPNCAESFQCNGVCCGDGESCVGLQCVSQCDDGRLQCGDGSGGKTCCGADQACIGQVCVSQGPACDIENEQLCLLDEFCDPDTKHCIKFSDAPELCRLQPKLGTKLVPKIEWRDDDVIATPVVVDLDTTDNDPTPAIGFPVWRRSGSGIHYFVLMKGTPIPGTTQADVIWRSDQLDGISPDHRNFATSFWWGPAAADVDRDGMMDFFAAIESPEYNIRIGGIIGFRADGTVRFETKFDKPGRHVGALLVADINADGTPEIFGDGKVLNPDGDIIFELPDWDREGTGVAVIADMNLDGYLDVVDGRRVYLFDKDAYEADPTVFKMNLIPEEEGGSTYPPTHKTGFFSSASSAIGYFIPNASSYPQIVSCGEHKAMISDWRGKLIAEIPAPSNRGQSDQRGGPPTVANFDDDEAIEFGCAYSLDYAVYKVDLTGATPSLKQLWHSQTKDTSSAITGSTVFDFDGDGKVEVVYNDEHHIHVYDGATGKVLVKMPNETGTAVESPVLADVDNDGHADMIAVSNLGPPHGVTVFKGEGNKWAPTRAIWNQHAYSVVNINKDGTVPQHQTVNWQQRWLNNFRQNIQPGDPNLAPNLIVEADTLAVGSCDTSATMPVTFRIKNVGDKGVTAHSIKSAVLVYLDDNTTPEAEPYFVQELDRDLPPNDAEGYNFEFTPKAEWAGKKISLEFVADYEDRIQECKEDDNKVRINDVSAARPDLEIDLQATAGGSCNSDNKMSLTITVSNVREVPVGVSKATVTIYRQIGSAAEEQIATITNTQELVKDSPETLTYEDTITSSDYNKTIKYRVVVDEENKITECEEDEKNRAESVTVCHLLG